METLTATNRNRIPFSFWNPCRGVAGFEINPRSFAALYRRVYGHSPHKAGGCCVYSAAEAAAVFDYLCERDEDLRTEAQFKAGIVYARRVAMAAASGRPYPTWQELDRRWDAAVNKSWRRAMQGTKR